jgi:hypothetical protein
MARRAFSDFDSELMLRMANRTDITSGIRAFLLNDALQHVANQYEHKELQASGLGTLTIGTDNFVISATDVWWPEVVQNNTVSQRLRPGDKDQMEAIEKRSGRPFKYYWWNGTFYVDCLSDATYDMKVWYVRQLAEWTTGEAPLDRVYDQLVLMWAAKMGFETVRDFTEAQLLGMQIGMYMAQMKLPVRRAKLDDRLTGLKVRL